MSEPNVYIYQSNPVPHGAKIEIGVGGGIGPIVHREPDQTIGRVSNVTSYSDGMVVGCTFVSNEALEKLWEFHQRYIKDKQSLKHQ